MSNETTTEVKVRPLTRKQEEFVKGIVAGKTKVQAAMDAYPNQSYPAASVQAAQNLEKPSIKNALAEAYRAGGINATSITDIIVDAMNAKKLSSDADGKLIESNHPDHTTRLNAVRTAGQLLGLGRDQTPAGGTTINFNLGSQNNSQ